MDHQIADFIDHYADQIISTDMEAINAVVMHEDDLDQPTSWEDFCNEADAWARRAQASNGFGGF